MRVLDASRAVPVAVFFKNLSHADLQIGAVTRASRVDFDDLGHSIVRVEEECKASFDHLKAIAKHDGNTAVKLKYENCLLKYTVCMNVSSLFVTKREL